MYNLSSKCSLYIEANNIVFHIGIWTILKRYFMPHKNREKHVHVHVYVDAYAYKAHYTEEHLTSAL